MQQPIRSLEHGGVRVLRTIGVRVARLRGQAGSFVRLTTWPRVPGGELLRGAYLLWIMVLVLQVSHVGPRGPAVV